MIPTAQRHLPINALLQNGKYQILNILGQGGFGITYLAKHQIFGEVALKELFLSSGTAQCSRENTTQKNVIAHFDDAQFTSFKDRFLEEARTLYKLKDVKGVVKVLDIFEENSTVYFSMEYLEGDKLEDYVKKRRKLTEKEGLSMILSMGRTLSDIHRRGVLHRDIKPANVIVGNRGEITLIDFGIARNYVDEVTETHTTFHSPRYSPPEQKIAKSRMGDYSDVYALGATAYYMLTGEQPQSLEERITSDYIPPKTYSPGLSDTINYAITKSLNIREKERYQKVDDFLLALMQTSSPATPPPYSGMPTQEVAQIVTPPVSDAPPRIETQPQVQRAQPIAEDDKTRLEQSPSSPKNIVEEDKTMLEKPPAPPIPPKNIVVPDDKTILEQSPIAPKNVVSDDKTILEYTQPQIVDEDKTLILGSGEKPKAKPFNWKEWLKTRDGRIIGGAVVLTIAGVIISAIVSTCNSRVPAKNKEYTLKPVDTVIQVVQVPIPIDTVKPDTVKPKVLPVVPAKKISKKANTQQTPTETYEPRTTTTLPQIRTEEPKPIISDGFCQAMRKPISGRWHQGGSTILICDDLSCNLNGQSGTYRVRDTNTKVILDFLMSNGKTFELTYEKASKQLEFEGKKYSK
jgi:serine/threonine protein kinase